MNRFNRYYQIFATALIVLFAISCSQNRGSKGVILPSAVAIMQIDVERLSEDIGGFEQFTGMMDSQSRELYNLLDQKSPILFSTDEAGNVALSLSLTKEVDIRELMLEFTNEENLDYAYRVGEWSLVPIYGYGNEAFIAQSGKEVVAVVSMEDEFTAEGIESILSRKSPINFTSSQIAKLYNNDISQIANYKSAMEYLLTLDPSLQNSDISIDIMQEQYGDICFLTTQNFEMGEIRVGTEIFNFDTELKGRVSRDIFKYIPQEYSLFVAALDLDGFSEIVTKYFKGSTPNGAEKIYAALTGEVAFAAEYSGMIPNFTLVADVDNEIISELLESNGMRAIDDPQSEADKLYQQPLFGGMAIYAALHGDRLVASIERGNVLSSSGVDNNATSSYAAKSLADNFAGVIIDVDAIISKIPRGVIPSSYAGINFMPLLNSVDNLEFIASSASSTQSRLIFKQSDVNALTLVKDEVMNMVINNF